MQMTSPKLIALILALPLGLSACAVNIRPLETDKLPAQSRQDILDTQKNVEPIGSTVDLNEAIARGLKYNLDFKVKQYEEAIATDQRNLAVLDMLPKVVGTAGYYNRNNNPINTSVHAQTGQPNNINYISTDREIWSKNFVLSWYVLDYGASYFN